MTGVKKMDKRTKDRIKEEAKAANAPRQNLSLRITANRADAYKDMAAKYKIATGTAFPLGKIGDSLADTLIEIVTEMTADAMFEGMLTRGLLRGKAKKDPIPLNYRESDESYVKLRAAFLHDMEEKGKEAGMFNELTFCSALESALLARFHEHLETYKKLEQKSGEFTYFIKPESK